MNFHIITIFPEVFSAYFQKGVIQRAWRIKEKIRINIYNLRDFTIDKRQTVDDTPYGGGPGMVLKPEPIFRAVEKIRKEIRQTSKKGQPKIKTILFSAKGKEYCQQTAKKYAYYYDHLILICGRYEGVDERVAKYLADEELSIGKYILTGGEIPAMIVVDSVARLVPGVLGNQESLKEESYNIDGSEKVFDYPVYTKPAVFRNWPVPKVLLSGDHQKIKAWRDKRKKFK